MFHISSRTAALVSVVRCGCWSAYYRPTCTGVFRQYVRAQERLAEKLRQYPIDKRNVPAERQR